MYLGNGDITVLQTTLVVERATNDCTLSDEVGMRANMRISVEL